MTKRRDIIKVIGTKAKEQGISFDLVREGSNHSLFSLDGLLIPIARHNEIGNRMAATIYGECAEKLGKDWWK